MHLAAMVAMALVAAACSNSTLPDSVLAGSPGGEIGEAFGDDGDGSVDPGGPAGGPGAATGGPGAAGGPGTAAGPGVSGAGGARPGATQARGGPNQNGGGGGSSTSVPGVTRNSVKISVSGHFSSAVGQIVTKAYENGMALWRDEVNAAGGIHGRQVVLTKIDNLGTAEGGVAACKEAKSNGSFMVMVIATQPNEEDCADEAGIPVLDGTAADLRSSWRFILPTFYMPTFVPAQVSFLKSSYMNAANKRIGIVYTSDVPQLAQEFQAMQAEMRKQGMNVVVTKPVRTSQASFVAEMQDMHDADAEVVMLLTRVEAPGIIRDAKATRFEPQWYAGVLGSSTDIVARAAGEMYQGVRGLRAGTTSETEAFATYREKVRKYKGDGAANGADTLDATVYAVADILGRILQLAGPNLTRQGLVDAARNMEPYSIGLVGPATWKGRPVGVLSLFPVECCKTDYTFRALGPAKETF